MPGSAGRSRDEEFSGTVPRTRAGLEEARHCPASNYSPVPLIRVLDHTSGAGVVFYQASQQNGKNSFLENTAAIF